MGDDAVAMTTEDAAAGIVPHRFASVSEGRTASIFRVDEYDTQVTE
jgi:hypothetical protein